LSLLIFYVKGSALSESVIKQGTVEYTWV
jgi:hypothetical protein